MTPRNYVLKDVFTMRHEKGNIRETKLLIISSGFMH